MRCEGDGSVVLGGLDVEQVAGSGGAPEVPHERQGARPLSLGTAGGGTDGDGGAAEERRARSAEPAKLGAGHRMSADEDDALLLPAARAHRLLGPADIGEHRTRPQARGDGQDALQERVRGLREHHRIALAERGGIRSRALVDRAILQRLLQRARIDVHAPAAGYLKQGFADKAIAIWRVAAQTFPEDVEYWERVANELVKRGRKADGVKTLLEGRAQLRSKRQRPLAMMLLRQVITLDAFHVDANLDLARLLAADGQKREAEKLLRDLRVWVKGRNVRRLRAAQFRLSPSWGFLTDWILGR